MNILRGYWKTILVACAIMYASLLREPSFSLPPLEHGDKWAHFLAYAILGAIAYWDATRLAMKTWHILLVAITFPIVYGGVIELMQELWFYPRRGELLDWLADATGVLVGCGVVAIILSIKARQL